MENQQLSPDFKEFLQLCLDHEVHFMVIGGMAVIHHGYSRLTLDLDILVAGDTENGKRILAVLKAFDFPNPDISPSHFNKERQILRIGIQPYVLELFSSIPGIIFQEAYPNRTHVDIDGMQVPFIGLADLRKCKSASGRTKDLLDLEELPEA